MIKGILILLLIIHGLKVARRTTTIVERLGITHTDFIKLSILIVISYCLCLLPYFKYQHGYF